MTSKTENNEDLSEDSINMDDILHLCLLLRKSGPGMDTQETRDEFTGGWKSGGGKCPRRFNQRPFKKFRGGGNMFYPNAGHPTPYGNPMMPPPYMQHMPPMPFPMMHPFFGQGQFRPPFCPPMWYAGDCNYDYEEEITSNETNFSESAESKREKFKSHGEKKCSESKDTNFKEQQSCKKSFSSSVPPYHSWPYYSNMPQYFSPMGCPPPQFASQPSWENGSFTFDDETHDKDPSQKVNEGPKNPGPCSMSNEHTNKSCLRCANVDTATLMLCQNLGKCGGPGFKRRIKRQLLRLLLEECYQNKVDISHWNRDDSLTALLTETLDKFKQQPDKCNNSTTEVSTNDNDVDVTMKNENCESKMNHCDQKLKDI